MQSLTRPIKLSHVRHVSLRQRRRVLPVQITRREMRRALEWGGSGLDADSHCGYLAVAHTRPAGWSGNACIPDSIRFGSLVGGHGIKASANEWCGANHGS
jgi:hypothetical protein